jgi:hypothetical protein
MEQVLQNIAGWMPVFWALFSCFMVGLVGLLGFVIDGKCRQADAARIRMEADERLIQELTGP